MQVAFPNAPLQTIRAYYEGFKARAEQVVNRTRINRDWTRVFFEKILQSVSNPWLSVCHPAFYTI